MVGLVEAGCMALVLHSWEHPLLEPSLWQSIRPSRPPLTASEGTVCDTRLAQSKLSLGRTMLGRCV